MYTSPMTQKVQPPTRRVFDFTRIDSGRFTTGEFKRLDGGFIGYWWTSGLNSANRLTLLCELQIAWASSDDFPETVAETLYTNHVAPLADMASGVRTTLELAPVFEPHFRAALLTEHLAQHAEIGNYSDSNEGLVPSIAKQYQLAESLGASTPVAFLAAWNGVPVSTIKKRIERARLDGLVRMKTQVTIPNGRGR
jgi:hypothetical protein